MNCVWKKLLVLAMACLLLVTLAACDSADYKKATGLYESGDYAAAEVLFLELGDYEDSAQMVLACRYGAAGKAMDAGEYAEAAEMYAELGDYEDSRELEKAARYALAEKYLEECKFDEAEALFLELGDYQDAERYLWILPGKRVVKWLQDNGPQEYVCPEPEYTVTLDANGSDGLVMVYEIGSSGEDWELESVFTAYLYLGNPEADLLGTGYIGLFGAEMDDQGSCVWHIDTYNLGDSVEWADYSVEGKKIDGSPLDPGTDGIINDSGIIHTSLQRMVEGVIVMLENSGLDVAIVELGFDQL